MSHDHHGGQANHHHGNAVTLPPESRAILVRGIEEMLRLTEGLEFRPMPSEKYPLPLTAAVYGDVPSAQTVRKDVQDKLHSDPVSVLENFLVLLELYECNQPDTAEYFLDDMKFLGACFGSKRCNGWVATIGDASHDEIEAAINSRWQFTFFPSPARPTGIYILLSMLARYASVYGRVASGDSHDLGHFIEDFCPGVIVCAGKMSDLELALSLAAMKIGVPAVVPTDYPFPLGRSIRADRPDQIAEAVVGFPNVRRLLKMPEIPEFPAYCDKENAKQEVIPAVVWGLTPESFSIVRKAPVAAPGFRVVGRPDKGIGIVVSIDAEPMDAFDCQYIERVIIPKLKLMKGVGVQRTDDEFAVQLAAGTDLAPERIGEVLVAAVGNEFPKLKDKVFVEVIFDAKKLAALAPEARAQKLVRRQATEAATEEGTDWMVGCTGCSPFAPDHVCVVTPQRPPQCGRQLGMLKTGALYGYDDMTGVHHSRLQSGVNSFAMIEKGKCLDGVRGEWSGADAFVSKMTQGRTRRVFLHCVDDFPHTGCGCFQTILFKMDGPRPGIGIMERGYGGRCPDGRTWKDLHYQLGGKQAPGLTGAAMEYVVSPKFLQGNGGWASIVWVSPKIAARMGNQLPSGVTVGEAVGK